MMDYNVNTGLKIPECSHNWSQLSNLPGTIHELVLIRKNFAYEPPLEGRFGIDILPRIYAVGGALVADQTLES
jgi:hypothetical protein